MGDWKLDEIERLSFDTRNWGESYCCILAFG